MSAIQLAAFAVCAAALALTMRRLRPEAAPVLIIAAGTICMLVLLPQLAQIVTDVSTLATIGGVQGEYTTQLLKIAGISLREGESERTRICAAKLHNDAGIIGAALLGRKLEEEA